MTVTIYHNSRCSKSRATLAMLKAKGIEPEVVNYLENPPTAARVKTLCEHLGIAPAELIRFKESVAKALGISTNDDRSNAEWCRLITQHPILMERPIVVVDEKRAALGRPPEQVLDIL